MHAEKNIVFSPLSYTKNNVLSTLFYTLLFSLILEIFPHRYIKDLMFFFNMCIVFQRTKIVSIEEIHNFNIDDEDIQIIKDFAYLGSVINSNGVWSQEIKRKLRLRRAAMEKLGKITKSKDVSLETKAKITYTLILPIIT